MPAVRRQAGFTLLEVLVSVSLTAAVLMILMVGLRVAEKAWNRGNDRLASMEQNLASEEAIQAKMSSAVPRLFNTVYEQKQLQLVSFRGDAKQVRFLSYYSWEGGRNFGLWLASYRIVENHDKEQLVVSETGLSDNQQLAAFLLSNEPAAAKGRPFGDSADRIEISYMRPSSTGLPAAWVQEWKSQEAKLLPRGVRIRWLRDKQTRDLLLLIPVLEEAQ